MPALDLALGLGLIGRAADVFHVLLAQQDGPFRMGCAEARRSLPPAGYGLIKIGAPQGRRPDL